MQPTRTALCIVVAIVIMGSGLCLFHKNKNNENKNNENKNNNENNNETNNENKNNDNHVNLLNAVFWFMIGCIGTCVFTSKQKNHEGKYVSNMIIVQNTSTCNNVCYHIHHWLWMLVVVILFFIANKFIINGKCSCIDYTNVLALYSGASISEYIKYGSDIFIIKQKCFSDCLLKRQ